VDPEKQRAEDRYKWLRQTDHEASRDFDKAIMTLSAGALGVSIAFVHDVAPEPKMVCFLGIAWVAFATSLVLNLALRTLPRDSVTQKTYPESSLGWRSGSDSGGGASAARKRPISCGAGQIESRAGRVHRA
jgi:hypothetical protein